MREACLGGSLFFWDNRVLELIGMEVGVFSISCRFKNCEDDFCWVFTGVNVGVGERIPRMSETTRMVSLE